MEEKQQKKSSGTQHQLSTFKVGELYFGVDILKVQEILRGQEMTPVPLAPPEIRGLINLRGQIITALDLGTCLGLGSSAEGANPMNVIVKIQEETMSLLVDEIGDVVEVSESQFESTPEGLQRELQEFVSGVYKLDSRLLLLLNAERTIGANTH